MRKHSWCHKGYQAGQEITTTVYGVLEQDGFLVQGQKNSSQSGAVISAMISTPTVIIAEALTHLGTHLLAGQQHLLPQGLWELSSEQISSK